MARPLRVSFEGAVYHVMFRGNERRIIFRDDADRTRFREQLGDSVIRYRVALYLVCLMPNHVHLLLGTPAGNLSAFVGRLLTTYAVYFNRRHRRSGHLTGGRFKAQVVEGDSYLLKLSRYIHLNPVCGRRWRQVPWRERLRHLRAYRWSTLRSYVGGEKPWAGVQMEPVLALVAPNAQERGPDYQRFVEDGLREADSAFGSEYRRSGLSVGTGTFNAMIRVRHREARQGRRRIEDVSFRRQEKRHPAPEVMKVVAGELGIEVDALRQRRRNSVVRGIAAWALQQFSGLTQREVADRLGMGTGAAVSRQTAKWIDRMRCEASAREIAARIARTLNQK